MRNLFDSPFLYWEKIGYVGYNNYTDLHLKVKKDLLYNEWKKASMVCIPSISNELNFSIQRLYNVNGKIKKNQEWLETPIKYSLRKNLKLKKFKLVTILDSLVFFYKKIYLLQMNFIKIRKFLLNWKRKKYSFILNLLNLKKKYIINYLKCYANYIKKIYSFFFKIFLYSFKKNVLLIKKKLYRYLKFFNQFSFLKTKKKNFYKLNKSIIKNIYLIYKNPFLMKKYKEVLGYKNYPLAENKLISYNYYLHNNSVNKDLFYNIPKRYLRDRQSKIKFILSNFFGTNYSQIKEYVHKYNLTSWEEFFYFFYNNLNYFLKNSFMNNLSLYQLNGKKIYTNSKLKIMMGDLIELSTSNKQDPLNLNYLIVYFYLLIKILKENNINKKYLNMIFIHLSILNTHLVE